MSKVKGVDEGMLVTLLLLMLEVPGRPGTVIPREALDFVGVVVEVAVEMTGVIAQRKAMGRLTHHPREREVRALR